MKIYQKIVSLAVLVTVLFTGTLGISSRAVANEDEREIEIASRFWDLFFKDTKQEASDERPCLIPSGKLFGLRLKTDGVIVVSVENESASMLRAGDMITEADGKKVSSARQLCELLPEKSEVTLTILREGKRVEQRCAVSEGKLGVTVRDSALGIGTVTYIDPETSTFGGLGHGITDAASGELIPIIGGDVTDVTLGGVTRGEVGKPGELCGVLRQNDKGDVALNHPTGVFGSLDSSECVGTPLPIAYRNEVHEGDAEVLCTVRQGKTLSYHVKIRDIDPSSTTGKSFIVEVTDPALIALTGGIVRGMSGSPIIQNGKLVGAVTHVMINDPTTGYGIFIENMLNAANIPMAKAS